MLDDTNVTSVRSKRFASLTGQENFSSAPNAAGHVNSQNSAHSSELELLKQEILSEMKRELHQVKQEIIDGETACL